MAREGSEALPTVLLVHPLGEASLATTGAYESLVLGTIAAELRGRGYNAAVHDVAFEEGGLDSVIRAAGCYDLVVAEGLYRTMSDVGSLARSLGRIGRPLLSVACVEEMFPTFLVVARPGTEISPFGVLGLGVRARPREVLARLPDVGFVLTDRGHVPHAKPVRNRTHVAARGVIDIEATRGCTYTCTFCSVAAREDGRVDRHWVARPAAEVVAEIAEWVQHTGVRRVAFVDDNLLGAPRMADDWLAQLAAGLKARHLSIAFSAYLRADVCTPERVALLADAGLVQAHVGIESGSDAVLDRLGKATTRAAIAAGLQALRARGVHVVPSLITFEPRQDIDELIDSLAWIEEHDLERGFGPHGLIPLPGTVAARELEDAGLVKPATRPWDLPVAEIADPLVKAVAQALIHLEETVDWYEPGWRESLMARRYRVEDQMSFLDHNGEDDLAAHDWFRRWELQMCLHLARNLRDP